MGSKARALGGGGRGALHWEEGTERMLRAGREGEQPKDVILRA